MTAHRIVFAVALLTVFALPAAAQFTYCGPNPPPETPRAGFTCTPEQGGGVTTHTTCTLYGDIAWAIEVMNGGGAEIPAGTCASEITFADADWTSVPGWSQDPVSGDVIAGLCFSDEPSEVRWLPCSPGIPATSTGGLVTLIFALAALGGFILWRRTV